VVDEFGDVLTGVGLFYVRNSSKVRSTGGGGGGGGAGSIIGIVPFVMHSTMRCM
jgi:hypothetical protein